MQLSCYLGGDYGKIMLIFKNLCKNKNRWVKNYSPRYSEKIGLGKMLKIGNRIWKK
jgi:hypothetical protein